MDDLIPSRSLSQLDYLPMGFVVRVLSPARKNGGPLFADFFAINRLFGIRWRLPHWLKCRLLAGPSEGYIEWVRPFCRLPYMGFNARPPRIQRLSSFTFLGPPSLHPHVSLNNNTIRWNNCKIFLFILCNRINSQKEIANNALCSVLCQFRHQRTRTVKRIPDQVRNWRSCYWEPRGIAFAKWNPDNGPRGSPQSLFGCIGNWRTKLAKKKKKKLILSKEPNNINKIAFGYFKVWPFI